ncbi:hypothetical protein EV182_003038, partial [Spiromyces aspiralis]
SRKPKVTWDEVKEKLATQFPYTLGTWEVVDRLDSMTKEEDEPFTLFLERFEQVAARSRMTISSDFLLETFLGLLPHDVKVLYIRTHKTCTLDSLREFLQVWDKNIEYTNTTSRRATT